MIREKPGINRHNVLFRINMGLQVALLSSLVPTAKPRAREPIDISLALEVSKSFHQRTWVQCRLDAWSSDGDSCRQDVTVSPRSQGIEPRSRRGSSWTKETLRRSGLKGGGG